MNLLFTNRLFRFTLLTFIFIGSSSVKKINAQPRPGDIFRDYVWTTPDDSPYKYLRVIGDGDYREPVYFEPKYPAECIDDGWIIFNHVIDLDKAVKAELQVEKVLCHDGTGGLAVKINGNGWHFFDMPDAVPEPKASYLQHNYPVVNIPLEEIKAGIENRIRFRVATNHHMPQNLLYGFHLRIYYNETKEHASARIEGVSSGQTLSENQSLQLTGIQGDIAEVGYIGLFRDVNFEGDGVYRQWHYTFYRGEIRNHIGTSRVAPFRVNWDISWLPDQNEEMQLSAFVKDNEGVVYFLPPVEKLKLNRDYTVELCTPYEIPETWVTRRQTFEEKLFLRGNPLKAEAFQLAFTTWSPGYLNGIYVNDWLTPDFKDCNYCYGVHRISIDKPFFLKQGVNIIKTGMTPRVWGKMVHGTEIQFPGIMMLVKYPKPPVVITEEIYKNTPHYKVETLSATWYIEKRSGGCSSLIDQDGRDWIDFKKAGKREGLNTSDSDYRGLPNLVHRESGNGVGHPGFDVCTTEQIANNELLVRSKDGKWQFRWVFHAGFAEIVADKTDSFRNYWFLFEGPAGGRFSPGSHYWGNDVDGLRTDMPSISKNPVTGYWQWAFFGDKTIDNVLFVAQKEWDPLPDFFAYMGNSKERGILSDDGMNVFGFGRGLKTTPELSGRNRFYVGFFPENLTNKEAIRAFRHYINEII